MPNVDVGIQRVSVAEMIKKLKELSTKLKENKDEQLHTWALEICDLRHFGC